MTVQPLSDLKTPIGEILQAAGSGGEGALRKAARGCASAGIMRR